MTKTAKSTPKKTSKCKHCSKRFSPKGVFSHQRFHCPQNPKRSPRIFDQVVCPICNKTFNSHYLRVHFATQHGGSPPVKIGRPNTQTSPRKKSTSVEVRRASSRSPPSTVSASARTAQRPFRRNAESQSVAEQQRKRVMELTRLRHSPKRDVRR
jgi:hypothetical protein